MFSFFKTKKKYNDVASAAFKKLITENPDAIILDVRTAMEFKQGAIKGAINMDIMDWNFSKAIEKLGKEKMYLVYCRSGNRSGSACKKMANVGFVNLYNLSGGISNYSTII